MNTFIKMCLHHGVQIRAYMQYGVLEQYEVKKIPDDILEKLIKTDLEKYTKGLFLSSLEDAGDWVQGHNLLKELGFKEVEREEGHRVFISLLYVKE